MLLDERHQSLLDVLFQVYVLVDSKSTWYEIVLGDSPIRKTRPDQHFLFKFGLRLKSYSSKCSRNITRIKIIIAVDCAMWQSKVRFIVDYPWFWFKILVYIFWYRSQRIFILSFWPVLRCGIRFFLYTRILVIDLIVFDMYRLLQLNFLDALRCEQPSRWSNISFWRSLFFLFIFFLLLDRFLEFFHVQNHSQHVE